jgi:hypothetical protein
MACFSCGRGLHEECLQNPCCCNKEQQSSVPFSDAPVENENIETEKRGPGRPRKDEISVSAGRKRAAVEYAINNNQSCEWRGLANCGGGLYPIVGCITGKQAHRHHGPIKDTSHNESGNIHLICTPCHNLWHARNDESYDEVIYSQLSHDPRVATPDEMLTRSK